MATGTTTVNANGTITGTSAFTTNLNLNNGTLTLNGTGARTITNTLVTGNTGLAGTSAVALNNLHLNSSATLAITGTGTKTVGGRLSGSGTISNPISLAPNAIHSPGGTLDSVSYTYSPGVGTQSISNVTYSSGSIFSWDLDLSSVTSDPGAGISNAGSYDRVIGAANGSGAVFNIVLAGASFADDFWRTDKSWNNIFSSSSSDLFTSFSGSGVSLDGSVAGFGSFSYSGNTLSWSSEIPEPTNALAGLLLAAGLLRRRR